ncbi:hypothetical protein BBP00_00009273 [Phytophthora kernoviae]|uniref:ABC transporter family G domain-containing protein n=1 Tax=Phytophthora kernoviae TaxID=325452 RepID=A0A3F2RD33_9STRA|nr:hypothetical protein BBP00_00009273 [Phytophthora kernoviae]
MMHGVSGGERKRVTKGEMAFGSNYVMMMDEISTGLDSVATFAIIATQRSIANKFCKTVVISLLQPSPEVFAPFDNVMFLNDGHIMYHGPREKTLGHFESLGFWHPLHRDGADFLLDLRTDEQYQYEVDIAPGDTVPSILIARFDACVYQGIDYCVGYGMTMGKYSLTTYEVPCEKF